jgi:hypothetical protein
MTIVVPFHFMIFFHHPLHYFILLNFDPSNQDDENFVMSLNESSTAPKEGLPTTQSKLGVKKRSYDATKKFQDSWVVKLP